MTQANQESSSFSSTLQIFHLWKYLRPRRRRQLFFWFAVMLLSGLSELISLGAVVPFLSALSAPEQLLNNQIIRSVTNKLAITDAPQILILVTSIFVLATFLAAVIRLTNLWLDCKFAAAIGSDLSSEAYKRVLYQPYKVHASQNSSKIIVSTTAHTTKTVRSITALLQLFTSSFVVVSILIGLFIYNWKVALSLVAFFCSCYALLVSITKDRVLKNSRLIALFASRQVKSLQEGFGAIRDIAMSSYQDVYLDKYMRADRPQRNYQASNLFLRGFPRFIIEPLGLCAIASFALISIINDNYSGSVISLLGVLALGSQRLLPAIQQIYFNWSIIRDSHADISAVLGMLRLPLPEFRVPSDHYYSDCSIKLSNVNFTYGGNSKPILNDINLFIPHGQKLGIIGSTGSGKTTLVDIIMALQPPSTGHLYVQNVLVDEQVNAKEVHTWRACIAHVPQHIYLSDATIAENIAFGLDKTQIDIEKVKLSARLAHIADYIEDCPDAYFSLVGEQGVRLSGGQRQRIGIARALYKDSRVIIFDEATSALDNETESKIIDTIHNLHRNVTIIMIAHRLSTLRQCDRIISLQGGHIVKDGTPSQMLDGYN